MRILILSAGEDHALGASYGRAFDRLGHEVTLIDPQRLLGASWLWQHRVSRCFLERRLIERFNKSWLTDLCELPTPDVVFVGKGAWAVPWLWTEYKRINPATRLVCYNADDPITTYSRGGNRPWVTQSIPCFDLFCTYNQALVGPLRRHTSGRVAHIPFAWDPNVHPRQPIDGYDNDVVFVGNGDSYREQWLTRILETPAAKRWRIAVFGSWGRVHSDRLRHAINPQPVYGVAMARIIARAKVSLNILRRQNENSHNMRTFEAPGCGGLVASQYSAEQDGFFPKDEAAIYFTTFADAAELIDEAIYDDKRFGLIRMRAREIVARHTYEDRAATLLKQLP